ncbi:MAG TPA: hypothetical protein VMC79_02555 [Rectinemataceae bacterium]|nr:hypothetical protein [Rectinemataceae bacterium]
MVYDSDPNQGRGAGATGAVRVLFIVAAALALVIAIGTVVGFASGSRQRKQGREAAGSALSGGVATFTGIGTLRATTMDPKPAIVVATIAFPYDSTDRGFAEEIVRKTPSLKAAAVAWFSRRKASELAPAFEGGIKAGLRDTFNSLLSLGKVEEIWLSDFSVVQ